MGVMGPGSGCAHADAPAAGTVKNGIALWFFGTFEMACLRPGEIVGFVDGLQKCLHASCKRSVKLFRAALQQVHCYLKVSYPHCYVLRWLCVQPLTAVQVLKKS